MTLLNPQTLPHDFPRRYVPQGTDLGRWDSVEPLFKELEDRPLRSPDDLKKWLDDMGEFYDCLNEEGSLRYIRMTCKTDDPEIEKAYLDYLEKVSEPSKPRFFALSKKYWDCPFRRSLPKRNFFSSTDRSKTIWPSTGRKTSPWKRKSRSFPSNSRNSAVP